MIDRELLLRNTALKQAGRYFPCLSVLLEHYQLAQATALAQDFSYQPKYINLNISIKISQHYRSLITNEIAHNFNRTLGFERICLLFDCKSFSLITVLSFYFFVVWKLE